MESAFFHVSHKPVHLHSPCVEHFRAQAFTTVRSKHCRIFRRELYNQQVFVSESHFIFSLAACSSCRTAAIVRAV